jgi:hypothetical protein
VTTGQVVVTARAHVETDKVCEMSKTRSWKDERGREKSECGSWWEGLHSSSSACLVLSACFSVCCVVVFSVPCVLLLLEWSGCVGVTL